LTRVEDRTVADRKPLSPLRRITIDNLTASRNSAVPASLFVEAAAEALLVAKQRRQVSAVRPTFGALVAKLFIATLLDHGDLNTGLEGDQLVRFADINLGLAVALPDGQLTLPVIHQAQLLSLPALAAAMGDLRRRALAGKLSLADVRGSVVALSSVGPLLPGMTAAPVLPAGHAATLLAGAAREAPVVRHGKLAVGHVLPLSLTIDHRIVNGMPAVAFLADLVDRIQDPEQWL
jgi:pyruvate dehydrogenase E2 component (dihydrolipoamide acetyltransferase)